MPGRATELARKLDDGLASIVVGNERTIFAIVVALLADGHGLLEGVPGTAKTLLVRTLAALLDASFRRIQFTPDVMPSDVVGTTVFNPQTTEFALRKGPIFASLVLADEINRTPPKTQSALLEAMEERQVTIDGTSEKLPPLFMVCATQNRLSSRGRIRSRRRNSDRFLVRTRTAYPSEAQELALLARVSMGFDARDLASAGTVAIATPADVVAARADVRSIYVADALRAYVQLIVSRTRSSPDLALGASPRAGIALLLAAPSGRRDRRTHVCHPRRREDRCSARVAASSDRATGSGYRGRRRGHRRGAHPRDDRRPEGSGAARLVIRSVFPAVWLSSRGVGVLFTLAVMLGSRRLRSGDHPARRRPLYRIRPCCSCARRRIDAEQDLTPHRAGAVRISSPYAAEANSSTRSRTARGPRSASASTRRPWQRSLSIRSRRSSGSPRGAPRTPRRVICRANAGPAIFGNVYLWSRAGSASCAGASSTRRRRTCASSGSERDRTLRLPRAPSDAAREPVCANSSCAARARSSKVYGICHWRRVSDGRLESDGASGPADGAAARSRTQPAKSLSASTPAG